MTMRMMTRLMSILLHHDPVYGTYRSERQGKGNTYLQCVYAVAIANKNRKRYTLSCVFAFFELCRLLATVLNRFRACVSSSSVA